MKTMTVPELKKLMEKDEVLLIDVRESVEHKEECIEGACLIPLGEISLEKLPSESRPIVIHCHSGKRSVEACKKLLEQNPDLDIYTLEGGIAAWKKLGFFVKKSKAGALALPLNRQVQLTAGFLVLAGAILGAFITPFFYGLSAFVGAGLMITGLTGWCGMVQLLAKMPWNK